MMQVPLSDAINISASLNGNIFNINNVNLYSLNVVKEVISGTTNLYLEGNNLNIPNNPEFLLFYISADRYLNHSDFCSSYSSYPPNFCDGFTLNFLDGTENISLIFIKGSVLNILRFMFNLNTPAFSLNETFNENYIKANLAFTNFARLSLLNEDFGSPYKKYCY